MNITTSSKINETVSWVGKWTFVLAAAGSAVGLGNIWGFPYKAGTEGGGAFVLIYLLCILSVGLPIMMAEIMIGRRARKSPVNAMKTAAIDSGRTSKWQAVGWGGLVSGILILSFYSVIAGICLNYILILFEKIFIKSLCSKIYNFFLIDKIFFVLDFILYFLKRCEF